MIIIRWDLFYQCNVIGVGTTDDTDPIQVSYKECYFDCKLWIHFMCHYHDMHFTVVGSQPLLAYVMLRSWVFQSWCLEYPVTYCMYVNVGVIWTALYVMSHRFSTRLKSSVFWDIMPCSLLKVSWCSSETSVDFQWTAWHYISENRTLHNHHCENLKSDKSMCLSRVRICRKLWTMWGGFVSRIWVISACRHAENSVWGFYPLRTVPN
jgi:hypothetical protein